jgi:hypothetical protein
LILGFSSVDAGILKVCGYWTDTVTVEQKCKCGREWSFDSKTQPEKKANSYLCDCGKPLFTSFGSIAYEQVLQKQPINS